DAARWLDAGMRPRVLDIADGQGLAREDAWVPGRSQELPAGFASFHRSAGASEVELLAEEIFAGGAEGLDVSRIAALFAARGRDFHAVCAAADRVRADA